MATVEEMMSRLCDPIEVGEAMLEMRARWHRAVDEMQRRRDDSMFTSGRLTGYEQCISLLLGMPVGEVHQQLMDEHITLGRNT